MIDTKAKFIKMNAPKNDDFVPEYFRSIEIMKDSLLV